MKQLLFCLVWLAFCLLGCDFTSKKFEASGSIYYTFEVPKGATKTEIVQTLAILKQRIAGYTAYEPLLVYDDTLQEIKVGVPKALAVKGSDACEKLLQTKGDFSIVKPFNFDVLKDKTQLIEATTEAWQTLKTEEDERKLMDFFQFFTNKNLYLGTARSEDTAQVRQVFEAEGVRKFFSKKVYWLWQKETDFDWKLCAYTPSENGNISRKMLKKATMDLKRYKNSTFAIELNKAGTEQLAEMTNWAIGEGIPLFLLIDGALTCAPKVMETIAVGKLTIDNYFSLEELMFYSVVLNAERLPFKLKAKN